MKLLEGPLSWASLALKRLFFVGVVGLLFMANQSYANQVKHSYVFGAGDEIEITVFGQDDLFLKTTLTSDGIINFRFIGEVEAVGTTKSLLEKEIQNKLKGDYLIDPAVSVNIVKYRNIYVHGEVDKPGGFAFEPGFTVNKAISMAGGFTERAANDKLYLVKEGEGESNRVLVELSTDIAPGDTLYIEKRFF